MRYLNILYTKQSVVLLFLILLQFTTLAQQQTPSRFTNSKETAAMRAQRPSDGPPGGGGSQGCNNPQVRFYIDRDKDGYGDPNTYVLRCYEDDWVSGYVGNNRDCNDYKNTVKPGAPEICDGLDNDCDGSIDEGVYIPTPSTPTVTVNCGGTILRRGTPPSGMIWYWQSTANGTSTSNSSSTITLTSGANYYIRAKSTTGNCWSTARKIPYTIYSIPPQPPAGSIFADASCGEATLVRENPPTGITWYWQSSMGGSSTVNSSKTITVTSGGAYFLRPRNNTSGCWGNPLGISYDLQSSSIPDTPVSSIETTQEPGKTTITKSTPPVGSNISWYWQNALDEYSTANKETSITKTSEGALYIRARSNTTGCWSLDAQQVIYTVNHPPSKPTATIENGCGVVTLERGNPPNGVTWYWHEHPAHPNTDNSSKSILRSSGNEYFLSARNNATGYWSDPLYILYTVKVRPETPTGVVTKTKACGKIILKRINQPSTGENWYWQKNEEETNTTNATDTIEVTEGTAVYLRAKNDSSDCWSAPFVINYTIDPLPYWYLDKDGDDFAISRVQQCASPGPDYTQTELPLGDCNDDDPKIHPDTLWYADVDNDTYGDPHVTKQQCTQPIGYVSNSVDRCPNVYGEAAGCYYAKTQNYVATRLYQRAINSSSEISATSDVIESVTYYDGIGRPKQQVAVKASTQEQDVITHIEYDGYGRQTKQYLPYEANGGANSYRNVNVITDINTYYKNKYPDDFIGVAIADVNAYSESVFENSPLNRVLQQAAPGKDWKAGNGHEIKMDYQTNTANEVRLFDVDFIANNIETPALTGDGTIYYDKGILSKSITYDENHTTGKNHSTEEFKDKQGRVVLKRTYNNDTPHDTYYVYDKYSNLTYVVPPKVNTSDGISATELNELCYQYRYDYRNRLIEKKIPGKGWEYIVYNKLDQPIMTQDANQRKENSGKRWDTWLFTKYDIFGRIAYTGSIINSSTRKILQSRANAFTNDLWVNREEKILIGGVNMYYNDGGYPKARSGKVLTINYYDDYNFLGASPQTIFVNPGTSLDQPITDQTKSLATGSKINVLGTNDWITTVTYYDQKSRPIYVASKNEYLSSSDVIENELDFTGKVLQTKTTHTKDSNAAIVTIDKFTYDHMGRVLTQTQIINGGNEELIASNQYDALGQLQSKKVGGDITLNQIKGLQTVDFDYNIRGWLTQINKGTTANDDLFGFRINYNTPEYGATALFNGNISETKWQTANDHQQRWYSYTYDALNRIMSATSNDNKYNLSGITYDKMGNILSLDRKGHLNSAASTFGEMDKLIYSYDSGNKLLKVTDNANDVYGFKDGVNTNDDFEYDANGNLTIDRNKGITNILYNHLNLPTTVTVSGANNGTINYVYDATGAKLKKVATESGNATTTEYTGNYVYKNGSLKQISHPEGYIEPNNSNGFDYIYYIKDQVNNVRITYSDKDGDGKIDLVRNDTDVDGDGDNTHEILQERNFYPFGLEHKGYNNVVRGSENKHFTYNGKEQAEELGLDMIEMDWRQYDPTMGRFISIDALADDPYQVDVTPYNFAWNNPILYSDPSGLCPECPDSSDFKPGDTYDVNGTTYLIDQDGQWVRDGGSLGEVIITPGGGDSEDTDGAGEFSESLPDVLYTVEGNVSVANLSGWDKFVAELHHNEPWLFGKRRSIDGLSFVDPSGNPIDIAPLGAPIDLPFGPGGNKNLVTKFSPEQLMKWWTTTSKNLSKIPKGFKLTKKFGFQHGQKVYQYKGKYYSKDVDSHNGGAWKVFEEVNGRLRRIGTAGEDLQIFKR